MKIDDYGLLAFDESTSQDPPFERSLATLRTFVLHVSVSPSRIVTAGLPLVVAEPSLSM